MPRPLQCGHGSVTTAPRPPHCGHTCENENGPWFDRDRRRGRRTSVHTSGAVPGFAPEPWHTEHAASAVKCDRRW